MGAADAGSAIGNMCGLSGEADALSQRFNPGLFFPVTRLQTDQAQEQKQ